jgi:hypothetical protein
MWDFHFPGLTAFESDFIPINGKECVRKIYSNCQSNHSISSYHAHIQIKVDLILSITLDEIRIAIPLIITLLSSFCCLSPGKGNEVFIAASEN